MEQELRFGLEKINLTEEHPWISYHGFQTFQTYSNRALNPNWHEGWYFYLLVIFWSDFVSWFLIETFQTFLRWKLVERRSPTDAQNMSADVHHVLSISKPTLQFFLLNFAWFIKWCFKTDISQLAILQWVENLLKKNYYSNQIPIKKIR